MASEPKLAPHVDRSRADSSIWRMHLEDGLPSRTYNEYLSSCEWSKIRAKVLRRKENRCQCCGAPATQIHHRSYSIAVLVGRELDQIVAICDSCHEKAERPDGPQSKCGTTSETNTRIDAMIRVFADQKRRMDGAT